jgi:hypothetical protein
MPRGIPNSARNNPVMAATPEIYTGDTAPPQRAFSESAEQAPDIQIVEKLPPQEYADRLAFAEQPVTGTITPASMQKAPRYVYCAIQGQGAEVWNEKTKGWMRMKFVPVNATLTMKRKYWEVLARARTDTAETRQVNMTPDPHTDGYELITETAAAHPFSVKHDPAGAQGHEWLMRVMSEA